MPTSKVIRPAVFDETGEHVIPADADLNLDPVSSDPDNYIVRGSDGGAFLNGDGVLSNDGENLLKITPNDGKVTYPRSDAVSLINETVQPSLDKLEDEVGAASDKADKAKAAADKAAESAKQADKSAKQAAEDAAAAQCTATQALNDAAAAQADADKAQARADAAYDKASDAQCAAADALDKAQEAVDSLPEIADAHSSIVTAGDGIKVDQSKLGDHNVYQVSVKRNGEDSGLISSTDGLEVELKGNGGLDKDKDGLYVDQQWIDEMVARYAKDHMLFNQVKVVKQLPEIPDADVHTIYLIRNRDSSATDAGTKDSFDGWIIVTTENGTQKWEEVGYKTDLRGYTHAGNTVRLTGDAAGTGTVDANGNVVVPTAVSHAASADKAAEADHAKVADSVTDLVFDSQIEGSGYQKFPGGLLIQWVTTRFILPDSSLDNTGIDVSNKFVIPFASAPVAIFAAEGRSFVQGYDGWEAGEWSVGIKDVSASAFTFRAVRNNGNNAGNEWSECVVVAFGRYGG